MHKVNTQQPLALQPCTVLNGVGSHVAEKLAQCGVHNLQDLLFHLPSRYLDNSHITPLAQLRAGEHSVVQGVISTQQLKAGKRPQMIVRLRDASGTVELRFLHYVSHHHQQLKVGSQLRCIGEVRRWGTQLCMVHPEYQLLTEHDTQPDKTLTPIYPTTQGLSQALWRRLTDQALALLTQSDMLPDYLPHTARTRFPQLTEALRYIHRPPLHTQLDLLLTGQHPMQQRLALEELLAHHLSLRRLRAQNDKQHAHAFPPSLRLLPQVIRDLPFALTTAQQRVLGEIANDLAQKHPMLRLIQGDVGCGKTIVAALACLQIIEQGFQVACMAPTELLAEQHAQHFAQWLHPLGIQTELLSSRHKGKRRTQILQNLAAGTSKVAIGTHALFQEQVVFAQLGLIIIDEQHRFGVHQRLALRQKGVHNDHYPHQMIMTATPIPRTLAMSVYADLDHSVIDQLPPGRQPITTVVLPNTRRAQLIDRIQHVCQQKQQVYWLCTLIEEAEDLPCRTAEETALQLTEQLPQLRIGLVHGRLKAQEKMQVMTAFAAGELDILVATTVIEVGVDVPNATLILIENAERLGLAQLHQLRGRVGRGTQPSFCVLLYQDPLSYSARKRLAILRKTQDGFAIAKEDLQIRGPGEVLGTRQAGLLQLRIADLGRDQRLLAEVLQLARQLEAQQSALIPAIIQRWLGHAEGYAHA